MLSILLFAVFLYSIPLVELGLLELAEAALPGLEIALELDKV
jgi:hypothetical protein